MKENYVPLHIDMIDMFYILYYISILYFKFAMFCYYSTFFKKYHNINLVNALTFACNVYISVFISLIYLDQFCWTQ